MMNPNPTPTPGPVAQVSFVFSPVPGPGSFCIQGLAFRLPLFWYWSPNHSPQINAYWISKEQSWWQREPWRLN